MKICSKHNIFLGPGIGNTIKLHWQPVPIFFRDRTLVHKIFIQLFQFKIFVGHLQPLKKLLSSFLFCFLILTSIKRNPKIILLLLFLIFSFNLLAQTRTDINLNQNWITVENDSNQNAFNGFEHRSFTNWKTVNVPHNWDDYGGYRRLLHGNRHGYAWYKKNLSIRKQTGKRYFLWFEGVGSYATVWLNGKKVGAHAGGRTSFTIDITDFIQSKNDLSVRADHPAFIKDLPWVCGACSDERGFSEGSQPMGIFRPVHLIITNEVRVEPFGVHVWNDETVTTRSAVVSLTTTIKNYTHTERNIEIYSSLIDKNTNRIAATLTIKKIAASGSIEVPQHFKLDTDVHLWSLEDPYLYSVRTVIKENDKTIDSIVTPYGIRWISWPIGKDASSNQFILNDKPVFINGIAEYEHLLGRQSCVQRRRNIFKGKDDQSHWIQCFP